MELDLDRIRAHYEEMPNEKLVEIAIHEVKDLRKEVIEVLRFELRKRGLLDKYDSGIKVQAKELSAKEIAKYADTIRHSICPVCEEEDQLLNATITKSSVCYFFWTTHTQKLRIACPECLDRFNSNAYTKSIFFTFWAFPHGWFHAISAFRFNKKMQKQNHLNEPNETLLEFIKENAGVLELVLDKKDGLSNLLQDINQ